MQSLHIEKTANTPKLFCDPELGQVRIAGQSYPENAQHFYQPLFDWIQEFLKLEGGIQLPLILDIDLLYFNSATSRVLQVLFDTLNDAASRGRDVVVNWHHHEENEMSLEYGEDFQEDLAELTFNILAYNDND